MLDSQGYVKLVDFGLAKDCRMPLVSGALSSRISWSPMGPLETLNVGRKDMRDQSKTFTIVGTAPSQNGSFPEFPFGNSQLGGSR